MNKNSKAGYGYARQKGNRWVSVGKTWPTIDQAALSQWDVMGDSPGRMFDYADVPSDIELLPSEMSARQDHDDYMNRTAGSMDDDVDEAATGAGIIGTQVPQDRRQRRPTSQTQRLTPVQQQTPWDQRMAQQRDRRPSGPQEAGPPPSDAQRRRDQTVGMRHKDTGLTYQARAQNSADRRQANVDTHLAARSANARDMEEALRSAIRKNLPEIVRKKEGGGGYVLYAPNERGRKRKKNPKPVGEFPTRAAAKKAELARFPPKGGTRLKRARKEVDRLLKDPRKAQAQDRKDMRARPPKQTAAPKRAPKPQTEMLHRTIARMVAEELQRCFEARFPDEKFWTKDGDAIHSPPKGVPKGASGQTMRSLGARDIPGSTAEIEIPDDADWNNAILAALEYHGVGGEFHQDDQGMKFHVLEGDPETARRLIAQYLKGK